MKGAVKVKELKPEERILNFEEVVLGYTEEEAIEEAKRCLQCKEPKCVQGCPVGVDIKRFISYIQRGDFLSAYEVIKERNDFPAICGRVCPAEFQCRKACILTPKGKSHANDSAIQIGFLERFVADYLRTRFGRREIHVKDKIDLKVAVIGSGPASLACAGELARAGAQVEIFESLHKPGGVLRYGIPEFRLPDDVVDYEIEDLKSLGVQMRTNYLIGKTKTIQELFQDGFKAIFIGTGAGTPSFLGIPGENLCNIYSANEYLTRVNLMKAYMFPSYHTPINIGKKVIVIGGGNTAMDAARVALRVQRMNKITGEVKILYRRTEEEMPARKVEIEHAKEEGIKFEFLVQPIAFEGENGWVKGIRCLRCRLGEPDESGRRRPIPIEGSEFLVEADLVIIAIGLKANRLLTDVMPEIKLNKDGEIIVDPATMETSIPYVYAGGDVVGGEGTVIEAMGMGKRAARGILRRFGYLNG